MNTLVLVLELDSDRGDGLEAEPVCVLPLRATRNTPYITNNVTNNTRYIDSKIRFNTKDT